MVYLPNEIINLILSFREVNPTSLIIKNSIVVLNEKYGFIVSPYYSLALVYNHFFMYKIEYNRLKKYYEQKNIKLTKKKKLKGIKFTYNESIERDFNRDSHILDKKYDDKMRGTFRPIIGKRPKN